MALKKLFPKTEKVTQPKPQPEQEQAPQPIVPVATATDGNWKPHLSEASEVAFALACGCKWLTNVNMSERKCVQFPVPPVFQRLVVLNMLNDIPGEAEWVVWNRLHGRALDKFFSKSVLNTVRPVVGDLSRTEIFQTVRAGVMNQSSTFWKKHNRRINLLSDVIFPVGTGGQKCSPVSHSGGVGCFLP